MGSRGAVFERTCPASEGDSEAPTKLGMQLGLRAGVVSVAEVEPDSYAEREWGLTPGLELLTANSRAVSTMDFQELMRVVRVERPLQLEFRAGAA